MKASTVRQTLWVISLLYVRCEVAQQDKWDNSDAKYNFTHELTQGASSSIVVPGNHSVAGELQEPEAPVQLTRYVSAVKITLHGVAQV
jgi:hypothetical protein